MNNNKTEIHSIDENIPHKISEVICIKCAYRWMAIRPVVTYLKDLECPWCGKQGFAIETGEVIND